MSNKTWIASLALLLSLAGAAAAQDGSGDPFGRAMEGAPPSGVRSGELRVPEAPPPAGQSPFTQPAPAAAPVAAASPAGPAGDGEETSDSVEITANYDATMGIYAKILESQGYETGSLEKRIASNEEIITRYKPELVKCEEELRRIQVEWMNSAFTLRRKREAGALSDDAFQKTVALEEAKFNRRRSGVAGDVQFYREEIAAAEKRLGEMRASKKVVEEKAAREGKLKPKPKPRSEALFDEMNARLDKLGPFSPRLPMDSAIFDVGRVAAPAPKPTLEPEGPQEAAGGGGAEPARQ